MKNYIFILLISTGFINAVYSGENSVAKVILIKGAVKAKNTDGTIFDVKENSDIKEGTTIETADKSFVKLLFIDKSQMNLGPKSSMVINAFPKKDPGIITLLQGQIRSKVSKDYMDIDDKNKSKLFIKTSSAAMGVRGTDFQVNYNRENHNTALITFEGAVAMAHINKNEKSLMFDHKQLEYVVSSDKAVVVREGQISAVNLNISEIAMTPTKLGKAQVNALRENETGLKQATSNSETNTKQFNSPIPPGIDGSILSNSPKLPEVKAETNQAAGFFNQKTGEYKLPAGSIIDLNSVNIIPPPVNAVFDANSKMFVVPTTFGKIDMATGEYRAPEGLKLGNDGKFQVLPKEEKKGDKSGDKKGSGDKREPASEAALNNMNPEKKIFIPGGINESRPEMAQFADKFANPVIDPNQPPPPPKMNDQLRAIANDRINTTETIKNRATDLGTAGPNSRARFIFNVNP